MRKEDKGVIIGQLADTVKQYGHFYLVDTTAMDAAATSDLRKKCFKAGIKLIVVKNSLLHKALMSLDVDYSPLFDSLKGTTSVMFCETANAPAKLLKEYKDGVPALKAAYAEEGFYVGADQFGSSRNNQEQERSYCRNRGFAAVSCKERYLGSSIRWQHHSRSSSDFGRTCRIIALCA